MTEERKRTASQRMLSSLESEELLKQLSPHVLDVPEDELRHKYAKKLNPALRKVRSKLCLLLFLLLLMCACACAQLPFLQAHQKLCDTKNALRKKREATEFMGKIEQNGFAVWAIPNFDQLISAEEVRAWTCSCMYACK